MIHSIYLFFSLSAVAYQWSVTRFVSVSHTTTSFTCWVQTTIIYDVNLRFCLWSLIQWDGIEYLLKFLTILWGPTYYVVWWNLTTKFSVFYDIFLKKSPSHPKKLINKVKRFVNGSLWNCRRVLCYYNVDFPESSLTLLLLGTSRLTELWRWPSKTTFLWKDWLVLWWMYLILCEIISWALSRVDVRRCDGRFLTPSPVQLV